MIAIIQNAWVVHSDLNDCNDYLEQGFKIYYLCFTDILLGCSCHEYFKQAQVLHMESVIEPLRDL